MCVCEYMCVCVYVFVCVCVGRGVGEGVIVGVTLAVVLLSPLSPLLSLPSLSVLLPTGIFHLYFFSPINFSRHICSFLARTVLSVYTGLSPIFLFCTSLLFATSLFLCGPLETWHVDRVPRPVSLEDGILVIEVTVGLRPLSTNTSLRPGLQLDGRSGRPGLINRSVAPLLWGCSPGSIGGV